MLGNPVVVKGVTTGFYSTWELYLYPQRLEWQEFKLDRYQLALYVRGLQALMSPLEDSVATGFFQIAGTTLQSSADKLAFMDVRQSY